MDWEETLYRWEEYSEKLYPLRDEVAHIFETKCFYDDNWEYQERLYEADDDTVFLLRLSGMLNDICDFVKSHNYTLSDKCGWDGFWETYDEVAKCLRGEPMSYTATRRAIEEFEASRKKLKLSA